MSAKKHQKKKSSMGLFHALKLFSLYFVVIGAIIAFIDFGAGGIYNPYLLVLISVLLAGGITIMQYFGKFKNNADDFVDGKEFK